MYGGGASENRFFPTLGNHDWRTRAGDPALPEPYLDYFTLPGNERYFVVAKHPVDLFLLDSNEQEPDGITQDSAQAEWLRRQLDESTAPWKLVVLHHAPYSSGDRHGSSPELQWPFKEWGATGVMAGHAHNYERLLVDQLLYLVNGVGGASVISYFVDEPVSGSMVRLAEMYGAVLAEANCRQIIFKFITVDGQVRDYYQMENTLLELSASFSEVNPQPGEEIEAIFRVVNYSSEPVASLSLSSKLPKGLSAAGPVSLTDRSIELQNLELDREFLVTGLSIPSAGTVEFSWPLKVDEFAQVGDHLFLPVSLHGQGMGLPLENGVVGRISAEMLLALDAPWQFLVSEKAPPARWINPGYDDETWQTGVGEFGYGEGDLGTVIEFGPDASDKYPTSYFRHSFVVGGDADYQRLILRLRRDDGAIVYLNGEEVLRSNMNAGPASYDTYAVSSVSDEDELAYLHAFVPAQFLNPGENVLAVEIHQAGPKSSDLRFSLELLAVSQSK